MLIQLAGITIEEMVITAHHRAYSFVYHYPHDDFVNTEDEQALFGEIFEDAKLFCRQVVRDLSNNDNFDRISGPELRPILIEINRDSDWIEDGIKDEVVTKISKCVYFVFGPNVKIVVEDCTFLQQPHHILFKHLLILTQGGFHDLSHN